MEKNLYNEFSEKALDTQLLSTPFESQTNWHVITGSSCSGKTTLINQLKKHGFKTIPEVARQYIEGEIARGHTLEDIRCDQAALTRRIYRMWLECLAELSGTGRTREINARHKRTPGRIPGAQVHRWIVHAGLVKQPAVIRVAHADS